LRSGVIAIALSTASALRHDTLGEDSSGAT
jgi:hypothetical protein